MYGFQGVARDDDAWAENVADWRSPAEAAPGAERHEGQRQSVNDPAHDQQNEAEQETQTRPLLVWEQGVTAKARNKSPVSESAHVDMDRPRQRATSHKRR